MSTSASDKMVNLDYKDPRTLSRFVTEGGKIKPRRQTRLNAKRQRELAVELVGAKK